MPQPIGHTKKNQKMSSQTYIPLSINEAFEFNHESGCWKTLPHHFDLLARQRYIVQFPPTVSFPAKNFGWSTINYFEIIILYIDEDATVGVGLGLKDDVRGMVGWKDSVGYHNDDGGVFFNYGRAQILADEWKYTAGDRIGVLYTPDGEVYFVKNGNMIDRAFHMKDKKWMPTVTCNQSNFEFRLSNVNQWDVFQIMFSRRFPTYEPPKQVLYH